MTTTINPLRPLGNLEHFFYAVDQLLGSMDVVCMYKLSKPITQSQLYHCAEQLRSKYQILQVTVDASLSKGTASYIQADHLLLNVQQHEQPTDSIQLMHKVMTEQENIQKEAFKNGKSWTELQTTSSQHLPWSFHLSHSGEQIIFSSPHCYVDGISFDILGGEIVRLLNGNDMIAKSFTPILDLPVERQIREIRWYHYLQTFIALLKRQFEQIDMMGIETKSIPSDWTTYETILRHKTVKMRDIDKFYQRCKKERLSLNSGMLSAFYEAMARTPSLNTNGKTISVNVPINARRRVPQDSDLKSTTIGTYLSFERCFETGDADKWIERAKRFHNKIHSEKALEKFTVASLEMGTAAKYALHSMPGITSQNFGRNDFLSFSNLGRTTFINEANEICSDNQQNVQVESLLFDETACGNGWIMSVHLATVGENISWCVSALQPFISNQVLDHIVNEFYLILTQ